MLKSLARPLVAATLLGLGPLPLAAQGQEAALLQQPAPVVERAELEPLATESADPFADDPHAIGAMADEVAAGDVSAACGPCGTRRGRFGSFCGNDFLPGGNFFVKTWLAQGYTGNGDRPNDGSNLPVTFNDRADDYLMNQLYVAFGKEVDKDHRCWDIGGRVDLLYGSDYFFTQAVGLETHQDGTNKWNGEGPRFDGAGNRFAIYGLAAPQIYAELLVPLGDATTVKLGHFYTIMGYESVMAPENFFYSHAYTMQYGEPFTHTGVLATTDIGPAWSFYYGLTRGWDTWGDPNGTMGFLGGFSFNPDDRTSLSVTVATGNEDATGDNNRTVYSLVLVKELSCRWTYVFQHDFGVEANAELNGNFAPDDAKWYGINQYLFCHLRDNLDLGLRVEWFRDQDNARVLGIPFQPFVRGGNYVETTLGLNWRPHKNVVLRPEVRYDMSDAEAPLLGANGVFRDFTKDQQLTIAFDVIITL